MSLGRFDVCVRQISCYSLLALVDSLEIDLEGKSEVIVKRALEKKFSTYKVDLDVDKSVRGRRALPVHVHSKGAVQAMKEEEREFRVFRMNH